MWCLFICLIRVIHNRPLPRHLQLLPEIAIKYASFFSCLKDRDTVQPNLLSTYRPTSLPPVLYSHLTILNENHWTPSTSLILHSFITVIYQPFNLSIFWFYVFYGKFITFRTRKLFKKRMNLSAINAVATV